MTTNLEALLNKRGEHAVGYFSCIVEPRQIDGGAKCSVDIENTELVEVYFDENDTEVPYIKPLEDTNTKGYIVMTSEVLHMEDIETKLSFFNGKDKMANVYVQEAGTTFKTTNFTLGAGATGGAKKGMYAAWKAGVDASAPCPEANGHYEITAAKPEGANVFVVWGTTEDETEELLGLDTVELYVPMV